LCDDVLLPIAACCAGILIPAHLLAREIHTDVIRPAILIDIDREIQHRVAIPCRTIKYLFFKVDIMRTFPVGPLEPFCPGNNVDVAIFIDISYSHPFGNELGDQRVFLKCDGLPRLSLLGATANTTACRCAQQTEGQQKNRSNTVHSHLIIFLNPLYAWPRNPPVRATWHPWPARLPGWHQLPPTAPTHTIP